MDVWMCNPNQNIYETDVLYSIHTAIVSNVCPLSTYIRTTDGARHYSIHHGHGVCAQGVAGAHTDIRNGHINVIPTLPSCWPGPVSPSWCLLPSVTRSLSLRRSIVVVEEILEAASFSLDLGINWIEDYKCLPVSATKLKRQVWRLLRKNPLSKSKRDCQR